MPNLEEIKLQLSHVSGMENLLGRKEIKELPSILWDDEIVEGMITGTYNNGLGTLFVTNKRLIFVDKGLLFGLKVEDFPLDKITSVQYETGFLLGKITIFASGNKAVIKDTDKNLTRIFGEIVRAKIENFNKKPETTNTQKLSENVELRMEDKIQQLERLLKLKEAGILTDEELATQKAKILN
ncbi:PH domain-containing protein [Acinetobacter sp. YH01020]|uniref:PH domain-containing protein n=1 Tax=Acinetobacter sp. YH01020 TaxID=2601034 RepID=UPI0015D2494E|nr:PH domain-containing protein [Acinetobacter sp. YH01020]